MAASTLSRVCGLTLGWSLSTRDTVWCDTPARRATSAMTGGLDLPNRAGAISRLPGLPAPMRIVTANIARGQPRRRGTPGSRRTLNPLPYRASVMTKASPGRPGCLELEAARAAVSVRDEPGHGGQ